MTERQVDVPACAAFISSYIDKMVGDPGRAGAASSLNLDVAILHKLGELASAVGELGTVRKIDRGWQNRPHTPKELAWMEAAVPLLIRRVSAFGVQPATTLKRLAMDDLPPL